MKALGTLIPIIEKFLKNFENFENFRGSVISKISENNSFLLRCQNFKIIALFQRVFRINTQWTHIKRDLEAQINILHHEDLLLL